MKKLLIPLLVLLAGLVSAGEITYDYHDTITAADSGDVRTNTVYTPWVFVGEGRYLNLGVHSLPFPEPTLFSDTNWDADSTFVKLQWGFDGPAGTMTYGTDYEVDTLLDTGRAWQTDDIIDADVTQWGPYMRMKIIHWDSIVVGAADSALVANSVYSKRIRLWFNIR